MRAERQISAVNSSTTFNRRDLVVRLAFNPEVRSSRMVSVRSDASDVETEAEAIGVEVMEQIER